MKLVDILAKGLKSWPEGLECLSQLKGTGYIINGKGFDGRAFDALQIADETLVAGAIVTRAEWQAAVDAMNAPNVDGPNIDWSAQPKDFPLWLEGTTEEHRKNSGWYRVSNQVFLGKEGGRWRSFCEGQFFIVHRKPGTKVVEWDGVGDPPVGTVCEYDARPIGKGEPLFVKVEVKYLSEQSIVIICTDVPDGENKENIGVELALMNGISMRGKLRPIRTAEQVAAEEREKAIKEICIDAGSPEMTPGQLKVAEKLYMAGYRKQVTK